MPPRLSPRHPTATSLEPAYHAMMIESRQWQLLPRYACHHGRGQAKGVGARRWRRLIGRQERPFDTPRPYRSAWLASHAGLHVVSSPQQLTCLLAPRCLCSILGLSIRCLLRGANDRRRAMRRKRELWRDILLEFTICFEGAVVAMYIFPLEAVCAYLLWICA